MEAYGSQVTPLLKTLIWYGGLPAIDASVSFHGRALWRGSLRHWLDSHWRLIFATALAWGLTHAAALQLAVFADEGIYKKTGPDYWNNVVKEMLSTFNKQDYAKGIAECVIQIGDALTTHFPYDSDTDKNELPDQIVFGK